MFKVEDRVRGTEGTSFEYATLLVIDTDGEGMVEVEVISHEFDEDQIGETEWVEETDLVLISTSGISFKSRAGMNIPTVKAPSSEMETLLILGLI